MAGRVVNIAEALYPVGTTVVRELNNIGNTMESVRVALTRVAWPGPGEVIGNLYLYWSQDNGAHWQPWGSIGLPGGVILDRGTGLPLLASIMTLSWPGEAYQGGRKVLRGTDVRVELQAFQPFTTAITLSESDVLSQSNLGAG